MKTHYRWLLATLCLTALSLVGPAMADAPAVVGLPHIPVRDNVTRVVLNNGLTILVVEEHATDIVNMEMLFRVGQIDEDSSNTGITNLIQQILVHRMTRVPGKKTDYFENRGAQVSANATPDYAEISMECTSDTYSSLMERIAEVVADQHFTDAEVTKQRDRLVKFLDNDNRVFQSIYNIFLEVFYRKNPYRQPQDGYAASVRHLTRQKVEAYYKRFWAPNKTVIAVVGDVEQDRVIDQLRQTMGSLPRHDEEDLQVSWEPRHQERDIPLTSASNLAWVFLGYPAPSMTSPDYMPMRVLATILGGGLSSRLWMALREKRGLAYNLGTLYPDLAGPAHIIDYTVTTPQHLSESEHIILHQVELLKTTPVSHHELEDAKRKLIGSYLLERETCHGRAFHLALQELLGNGYQADLLYIKRLERVTPEDILRVARTYLNNSTLITARPPGSYPFFQ